MEYNALGYSGTNSGGAVVIEHSTFDNNQDGFDTNTQINGDPPAPQNGACPNNGDLDDHPHALAAGSCSTTGLQGQQQRQRAPRPAAPQPARPGTGMTVSGGTNDTVLDNDVRGQRRVGHPVRPVSRRQRPPWLRPDLRGHRRPRGVGTGLRLRPPGRRADREQVHRRRLLQEPIELRLRRAHAQQPRRRTASANNSAPTGVPEDLADVGGARARARQRSWERPRRGAEPLLPGALRHRLRHLPGGRAATPQHTRSSMRPRPGPPPCRTRAWRARERVVQVRQGDLSVAPRDSVSAEHALWRPDRDAVAGSRIVPGAPDLDAFEPASARRGPSRAASRCRSCRGAPGATPAIAWTRGSTTARFVGLGPPRGVGLQVEAAPRAVPNWT